MRNSDFKTLKEVDIYSLSMFMLYKLVDIKEYSLLGELPYILDKDNLLNFCNYFGGRTIRVPTTNELYSMINLIMLYQHVKIEGVPYSDAINLIGYRSTELRKVKSAYNKLCVVLDKYNFNRSGK